MEESRKRSMQDIQVMIKPELKNILKFNKKEYINCSTTLLKRKLERPSVRSYFVYWVHQYLVDTARIEGIPIQKIDEEVTNKYLPFIIEAVMSTMYLHNQVLDKKQKVKNTERISNNLIGSNLLKDAIYDYIEEKFGLKNAAIVQAYVRKMFRCVDVGQYFDSFYSYKVLYKGKRKKLFEDESLEGVIRLESFEDIIASAQQCAKRNKDVIEIYFKRNYLISSALFRYATEILMHLLGYEGKEKEKILQFAECYGIMMQLINDTSDFVKDKGTLNRSNYDVLSDLRNKTITLPVLLHLGNSPRVGLVYKALQKKKNFQLEGKHNEILKELIFSEALQNTMKIGRDLAKLAEELLCPDNKVYHKLKDLLSIAYKNRYYHHIYKAKKHYTKPANKEKLYSCEEEKIVESPDLNPSVEGAKVVVFSPSKPIPKITTNAI